MVENTSNTCVIDASYILAFLMPDEKTEHVDDIFLQHKNHTLHFVSHALLRYELIGGLKSGVLRKRIDRKAAATLVRDFLAMEIFYAEIDFKDVLKLSIESGLTPYDAGYLWLSQEKKLPLLTLDRQLARLAAAA